jgi:hypothetical protein
MPRGRAAAQPLYPRRAAPMFTAPGQNVKGWRRKSAAFPFACGDATMIFTRVLNRRPARVRRRQTANWLDMIEIDALTLARQISHESSLPRRGGDCQRSSVGAGTEPVPAKRSPSPRPGRPDFHGPVFAIFLAHSSFALLS